MSNPRLIAITIALLTLMTSCGGQGDTPAELAATDTPLPVPTGEVVLTIRGAANPNVGDEVQVDLAAIESLGTTTVVIDEPFINEQLEMTGVPVATVLAAAGIGPDDDLVWTALDDYQVHFNRREAADDDALLATRIDGQPIAIADGGPVRVVFLDTEGSLGRDTNQWIWSLNLIELQ